MTVNENGNENVNAIDVADDDRVLCHAAFSSRPG